MVDNRSVCNMLTWEATIGLQVDLTKLKKVTTPLIGIRGKLVRVKGTVELRITLWENNKKKILKQSFMVTRIDALYNTLFGRLLLNKLSVVLSPRYLLMKFEPEPDKGIVSIMGNQIEARRGCMMVARAIIKQPKIMILKTPEEWDRRRKRITEL